MGRIYGENLYYEEIHKFVNHFSVTVIVSARLKVLRKKKSFRRLKAFATERLLGRNGQDI